MNRKIVLFLSLLLLPFLRSSAQSALELAAAAEQSYRSADYASAAEQYEQLLASGLCSADVYYNLANAYFRLEQYGKAILNYERALRLNPGMTDARENLALANSRTTDRITPLPTLLISRLHRYLISHISPHTWRLLLLLLFALFCASLVFFRLSGSRGGRRAAFVSLIVSFLLLIPLLVLLLSSTARFNSHSEAIIIEPSISIKGSPEARSVDKMVLHEGTKLTVEDQVDEWYKVKLADGTTGWCLVESIERI